MTTDFHDALSGLLDAATDSMIEIRHDLHQFPELSFDEFRTSDVITNRLNELHWDLQKCPTPTGAVATLDTGKPGRVVMIRADIDALPVHEEVALSFASRTDGVMHACGHDVHTAALLGVADLLGRRAESLVGKFVVVFQPAEESLGGARAMIDGGVLDDHGVEFVVGAHVTSLAPVGLVAVKPGIAMSEATSFSMTLTGKGGHGAMANVEGNVILAVTHLAQLLGTAIAGLSFEGTDCACSAGVIQAGTANNVVPRRAILRGTLRTFSPNQFDEATRRLEHLAATTSREFAVECVFGIDIRTPMVINNPVITESFAKSAKRVVGDSMVIAHPPASPSDDVSEFLNERPGCYAFVGGAMPGGSSGMHHSPDFAVDDGALRVMAGVLASVAVDLAQI